MGTRASLHVVSKAKISAHTGTRNQPFQHTAVHFTVLPWLIRERGKEEEEKL
jgi:hypothetical protein